MSTLYLHEVLGDAMEPKLRSHDFVLCAPCIRYSYARMYVMRDGALFYASSAPGGTIHLWTLNRHYTDHYVPMDWFNANVAGAVMAEVSVKATRSEMLAAMAETPAMQGAAPLALAAA